MKKETKRGVSEESKHFSNRKIEFIIDEWRYTYSDETRYNENIIENYRWTIYVTHALHIN